MYKAIAEVHKAFDKAGIKHKVDQIGDHWMINTGMTGKFSTYQFLFIKTDDTGNDIAMRIFKLVNFPKHKAAAALTVLNSLQQEYRYLRFVLDDDGDVNVEYDFPAAYSPIGDGALEMVLRTTNILDECYPKLMRSIWG